jgi:hypothetical protein
LKQQDLRKLSQCAQSTIFQFVAFFFFRVARAAFFSFSFFFKKKKDFFVFVLYISLKNRRESRQKE